MGTLGPYLKSAREAKDIDIRDAAQQTRIRIDYLKALEAENFSKLPGEVFVRGFLKNYARFLSLDEAETLKRYADLKPAPEVSSAPAPGAAGAEKKLPASEAGTPSREETPIEPFVWGAVIFISLLVFLFTSLPGGHSDKTPPGIPGLDASSTPLETLLTPTTTPGRLYLEVVALENTWLLVRTDTSPRKKAVLKKGESLIWSADERFQLSYAGVEDLKLLLNGEELTVRGSGPMPVRDLVVMRTGILNQPAPVKQPKLARPKPRTAAQPARVSQPLPKPQAEQPAVQASAPAAQAPAAVPATAPVRPEPAAQPAQAKPAQAAAAAPAAAPAPAPAAAPAANPATAPSQSTGSDQSQ